MPIHDWTRVEAETFHAFHCAWIIHLSESIHGLLPTDFYALPEQRTDIKVADRSLQRTAAIRRASAHRRAAIIEIVAPGNKSADGAVREFIAKIGESLLAGIHVAVIDLFPPGKFDVHGVAGRILTELEVFDPKDRPDTRPLIQVSFEVGSEVVASIEHRRMSDSLPDLPLFCEPDRYINLPLESTYTTAFRGMPAIFRKRLET